jgi:hypothetical protein
MRATAVCWYPSNVVDLYDSGTGRWSTAQLSLARGALSATSVGTVAIFAGGVSGRVFFNVVDFYQAVVPFPPSTSAAPTPPPTPPQWSRARLSQARQGLSATSVGTVAFFAGGRDGKLLRIVFVCCVR